MPETSEKCLSSDRLSPLILRIVHCSCRVRLVCCSSHSNAVFPPPTTPSGTVTYNNHKYEFWRGADGAVRAPGRRRGLNDGSGG